MFKLIFHHHYQDLNNLKRSHLILRVFKKNQDEWQKYHYCPHYLSHRSAFSGFIVKSSDHHMSGRSDFLGVQLIFPTKTPAGRHSVNLSVLLKFG